MEINGRIDYFTMINRPSSALYFLFKSFFRRCACSSYFNLTLRIICKTYRPIRAGALVNTIRRLIKTLMKFFYLAPSLQFRTPTQCLCTSYLTRKKITFTCNYEICCLIIPCLIFIKY